MVKMLPQSADLPLSFLRTIPLHLAKNNDQALRQPTTMADDAVARINLELHKIISTSPSSALTRSSQTEPEERISLDETTQFETLTETFILGTSAAFAAELLLMPVEGGLQKHLVARLPNPSHAPSMLRPLEYRLDWKGVGKDARNILATRAPVTGLLMTSYDWAKRRLKRHFPDSIAASPLRVGLVAGPIAQLLESAIWTPVSTMQSASKPMRQIISQQGFKGLYTGFWNNYFATVPYIASFLAIGEWSTDAANKRYKQSHPDAQSLPISWLLGTGIASGSVAVLISTPLEMLRQVFLREWANRQQLQASVQQQGLLRGVKQWALGVGTNDVNGFLARLRKDVPTLLFKQAPRTGTRKVLFAAIRASPARVVLKNVLRSVSRSAVKGLARGGGLRAALKVVFTRVARLVLRRGK